MRAGARASREVPGAVAVGGTVCALYARHRLSIDIDFVVGDLRDRYDRVREHLLEVPGWTEASARPPVLILGSLDGVQIGFRQLRRDVPFETVTVDTPDGPLTVPTLPEMLRTKAYMASTRNAIRDYIDFAELSLLLPDDAVVAPLADLDAKFASGNQPSVALGVVKALMHAEPKDADPHRFDSFRWLQPRLESWDQVRDRCRSIGASLGLRLAAGKGRT